MTTAEYDALRRALRTLDVRRTVRTGLASMGHALGAHYSWWDSDTPPSQERQER